MSFSPTMRLMRGMRPADFPDHPEQGSRWICRCRGAPHEPTPVAIGAAAFQARAPAILDEPGHIIMTMPRLAAFIDRVRGVMNLATITGPIPRLNRSDMAEQRADMEAFEASIARFRRLCGPITDYMNPPWRGSENRLCASV